jgi:hypothetical protein
LTSETGKRESLRATTQRLTLHQIECWVNAAWTGWLYVDGIWEAVAAGDALGVCRRRLVEIAEERGIETRDSCLTRGSVPSSPPIDPGKPDPHARWRCRPAPSGERLE